MKYYLFDYSPDKFTKVIPQCVSVYSQKDYDVESEFSKTKINSDEFPPEKVDFSFVLEKKAELTNFVDSSDAANTYGLLMDEDMYRIFQKYKLYNSRFYPATVEYKSKKYSYYWLHVLVHRYDENVDFERTTFVDLPKIETGGVRARNGEKEIKFRNIDDKIQHTNSSFTTVINKLVLKDNFVAEEYDFFYFLACNVMPTYFISERLFNDLKDYRPNGCSVSKQNILEGYSYP